MFIYIYVVSHLHSAGVGRSGTYITLDTMLQRMPHTNDVNIYEFVYNMRKKRVQMVQTQVSNMCVHTHVHIHSYMRCIVFVCACVSMCACTYMHAY